MRVATMLAAIAALWAMPAQAVSILLTAPDPTQGVHQKITVTGLGAANVIQVISNSDLTGYWNEPLGGGLWYLNGNTAGIMTCIASGSFDSCEDHSKVLGVGYPVEAIGSIVIRIANNEIFVDWAKTASFGCGAPDPSRDGLQKYCGFAWEHDFAPAKLELDLSVLGPATDWNYSVETLGTFAVPEPATWALMILGIGLAGATMRRRRYEMVTALLGSQLPSP